MDDFQKVVWSEGMFLLPHHFQQWERHHEQTLSDRFHLTSPFSWGCADLQIDLDGLANGTFSLLNLRGIMPDGLLIQIPEQDPSPPTRPIGKAFASDMDHLDVYLGLPEARLGGTNVSFGEAVETRPARYSAKSKMVTDYNSGENRKEISVSRKNWKIFFSGEVMSDYVTLKIAELVRTTGGAIALRESYIPPCTQIAASPYLMRLVRGLMDVLAAKCEALSDVRRAAVESGSVNPVKLALLLKMTEAIPFLAHASDTGAIHPQSLYLMLSQLTGALATFYPDIRIQDFPRYQHQQLAQSFMNFEKKIRIMTGEVSETTSVLIPLEQVRPSIWAGQVSDERLFETSQFFLRVSGELPEEEVRETFPLRIKIGAAEELDLIISSAMPGVRLYFTPRPPSRLPVKAGHQYFRLDDHGSFWDAIRRSRSIGLYIPADLKGVQFELVTTKE
ncbi:Uncharacterized protein ImpJ/VasE [hydrothermal vent metagenome]|uniref:Uncharacterized protein ImpJ/VasE n=1 Tax=hydrothermal vent metagenome TaxID=652676 RepID=A0A3B1CWW3_9ZZZZ